MTGSEFVLTPAHLLEATLTRTPENASGPLQKKRRKDKIIIGIVATVLTIGCVGILAGSGYAVAKGNFSAALAGLPVIIFGILLLRSRGTSRRRNEESIAKSFEVLPWLSQPCRLTIEADTFTLSRASVELIVTRDGVHAHDELPKVFRIIGLEDTFLIDLATLRRDGMLEPLRNWLAKGIAK